MVSLSLCLFWITLKAVNPIIVSTFILVTSIILTMTIFKTTSSSWISFVTILTFSSGMMMLFMYAASLSPIEKNKTKNFSLIFILVLFNLVPFWTVKNLSVTMKKFSSNQFILIMVIALVITMISIIVNSFNPSQSVNTSF